ncbi:interleukin-13 receptor subunit alpha-1-like isoform X1 [Engystomops pustulosus]|uniref:interleukin-13 receptor subunit alpha-1-like isoform X1 n=2 Tax=Engystomops pustulosus TaxID=76066 RepID=UPI003AFAE0E4
MDLYRCRLLPLLCCLCAHWTCGTADTGPGQLYPPSNITFEMKDMFCLYWTWTAIQSTENCTLWYKTEISSIGHKGPAGKTTYLHYAKSLDNRVNLNENITLKMNTLCDNRTSEVKTFTSSPTSGNPRTMVRNMTCIWDYKEYVNCTWRPGEDTPPNVNYILRYWIADGDSCPPRVNKQSTLFRDLLGGGELCQNYTSYSGNTFGCLFRVDARMEFKKFLAVVMDRSQNIRPYIYFIPCINSIAKLKAPVIHLKRTPNNTVLVQWNVSDTSEYDLEYNILSNTDKQTEKVAASNKEFFNILPDVQFAIKVRVALAQRRICSASPDDPVKKFLWSDWSEIKTLPAVTGGRITLIVILLLVSLVIIVATILLLINMRRLLILICPRIPDPGKVISRDFPQWLQYGKPVYNEPKKEEVSLVSLLDTQPSSSQVEQDLKWKP